MRRLREYKIHEGSGPVVQAATKMEAIEIYAQKGFTVTCNNLRLLRKPKWRAPWGFNKRKSLREDLHGL